MDARDAIEEARRHRAETEGNIASYVQAQLFELERRTALCPQSVRINMIEITDINDLGPRCMVESVEIDLGRI